MKRILVTVFAFLLSCSAAWAMPPAPRPYASEAVAGITTYCSDGVTSVGAVSTCATTPTGVKAATDLKAPLAGSSSIVTVGTVTAGDVTAVVSAATDSLAGKVELATPGEAQTGADTTRALTAAGLNSVVFQNAKVQLVNSIMTIFTPANVKGLWVMDQTGAVSTITDRATLGGASAHTLTLIDASSNPINASTCTPVVSGLAPGLTFDASHMWEVADSADFTAAAPATMSVFIIGKWSAMDDTRIVEKDSTGQEEWRFMNLGGKLYVFAFDTATAANYIGRLYNTSITADYGAVHSYGFTYGGGTTSASLKIYRDGVQVDDTDSANGSFTTMKDGTSKVTTGLAGVTSPPSGAQYVVLIVKEEATATQAKRLDAVLKGYAGTTF